MGTSWGVLGRLGSILGTSWRVLGAPSAHLDASWSVLERLGHLQASKIEKSLKNQRKTIKNHSNINLTRHGTGSADFFLDAFCSVSFPFRFHFVSCFVPVSFRKTSFLWRNNFKKQPNNVLKSFSNRSKIALACCCSCAVGSQIFLSRNSFKKSPNNFGWILVRLGELLGTS